MFKCTIIENKQEKVITVEEACEIPIQSIKVETDIPFFDADEYLHLRARRDDISKKIAELQEARDSVEDAMWEYETYV